MRLRRVVMPETAKPGQIIEIKALIAHPMVPGHTASGTNQVARRIVKSVVVRYDGAEIFRADLGPGVAANPVFTFTTRATVTGDMVFTWTEDSGLQAVETRRLSVAP